MTTKLSMGSIFDKNANNFNLVRLLAALIVIYSHSYAWSGGAEWVAKKSGVTHAGELSVVVFFFISGALVTKSLAQSETLSSYLIKRVARIYPALIVCCLFVAYFVSWAFGGADITKIFSDPHVRKYFIDNAIGIWNIHHIPGVFEDHPEKSLNGSLWSITLELRLYLFLALLALMGLTKSAFVRCIVFLGAIVVLCISPGKMPLIGNNHALYGTNSFPDFSIIFLLGGVFYTIEKKLRLKLSSLLVISILWMIMARNTELYRMAIFAFSLALALWIATSKFVIDKLSIKQDYSYGVYLYGWPAQQIAYSLLLRNGSHPSAYMITSIAIPIALALAVLSWHLIEKPGLEWGRRLIHWAKAPRQIQQLS